MRLVSHMAFVSTRQVKQSTMQYGWYKAYLRLCPRHVVAMTSPAACRKLRANNRTTGYGGVNLCLCSEMQVLRKEIESRVGGMEV